ncbi:hypothetical protein HK101_007881 [Irineochytrium annulatum]|nr:hypothetical protein HK101_007881 [Irineochytrium annulatum]
MAAADDRKLLAELEMELLGVAAGVDASHLGGFVGGCGTAPIAGSAQPPLLFNGLSGSHSTPYGSRPTSGYATPVPDVFAPLWTADQLTSSVLQQQQMQQRQQMQQQLLLQLQMQQLERQRMQYFQPQLNTWQYTSTPPTDELQLNLLLQQQLRQQQQFVGDILPQSQQLFQQNIHNLPNSSLPHHVAASSKRRVMEQPQNSSRQLAADTFASNNLLYPHSLLDHGMMPHLVRLPRSPSPSSAGSSSSSLSPNGGWISDAALPATTPPTTTLTSTVGMNNAAAFAPVQMRWNTGPEAPGSLGTLVRSNASKNAPNFDLLEYLNGSLNGGATGGLQLHGGTAGGNGGGLRTPTATVGEVSHPAVIVQNLPEPEVKPIVKAMADPFEVNMAMMAEKQDAGAGVAASMALTRGKSVVQELGCRCKRCGSDAATFKMYGTLTTFEKPYASDFTCAPCFEIIGKSWPTGAASAAASKKRAKRKIGEDTPAECNLCSKTVGFGGVRMVVSAAEEGGDAVWIEPDFQVELYCRPCLSTYRKLAARIPRIPWIFNHWLFINSELCKSCGGGGVNKSGKWRPTQLFKDGRKTCSLPHLRLGNPSTFRYVVYRCPLATDPVKDITPFVVGEPFPDGRPTPHSGLPYQSYITSLRDEVVEAGRLFWLNYQAEAHAMRDFSTLCTYDKIDQRERIGRMEIDRFIRGVFRPGVDTAPGGAPRRVRRYLPVAYVPDPKARKGGVGDAHPYLNGGFTLYTWDLDRRSLHCGITRTLQQHSLGSSAILNSIITGTLSLIVREMEESNGALEKPLHVWTFFRRREKRSEGQIRAVLRRLGLMPMDEYAKKIGISMEDATALFDNQFEEEETWRDMEIFCGSWNEYFSMWSLSGKLLT